jgi:hypothetical protein
LKLNIFTVPGSRKASVYFGEDEDVDGVEPDFGTSSPSKRSRQDDVVVEEAPMPTSMVGVMLGSMCYNVFVLTYIMQHIVRKIMLMKH